MYERFRIFNDMETHSTQLKDRTEIAKLLGVHADSIYRMTASGQIPAIRLGKKMRYDEAEVLQAVKELKYEKKQYKKAKQD